MAGSSRSFMFGQSLNSTGQGFFVNNDLQDLNAAHPNLERAREKRNSNMIRIDGYEASIIGTSVEEIGKHGVALELYFVVLKHMGFLFFIISLISIWPISLNFFADGLKSGEKNYAWDQLNLSNQVPYNYTMSKDDAEDNLESNKSNKIQIVVADLLYCLIFIVYLFKLKKKLDERILKNQESYPSTSDYSVEVKGFNLNTSQGELKEFFESNFGVIKEVFLFRKCSRHLYLLKNYEKLLNRWAYLERLNSKYKNQEKNLKKIKLEVRNLKTKYKNVIKKSYKVDELPPIKGFVIFNKVEDRNKCINAYIMANRFCCRSMNNDLKFNNRMLSVIETSEPSNINWENLEYESSKRFMRGIISPIFGIIILIVSIVTVYALRSIDDGLPSNETCLVKKNIDSSLPLSEAKLLYTSNTQKYCYCNGKSLDKVLSDSSYNNFCEYYLEKRSLGETIRFSVSISILFINNAIKFIFKFLGRYEIENSKSKELIIIARKTSIALFINTALVILFVNSDFSSTLFDSGYSDFSKAWYIKVGSTITLTMVFSIISPHFLNLFFFYPIGLFKRHCLLSRYKTQLDMDNAFVGPEFDLTTKYAQLFTIIFTSFMYSGGIPFLNCTCCASMFLMYWVDKFLILRHNSKPPMYSSELNSLFVMTLPFAVAIHCGFSLYMVGAEDVFPESFYEKNGYIYPSKNSLIDRVGNVFGIFYIIMIAVALALYPIIMWAFVYFKIRNQGCKITEKKYFHQIEDELAKYTINTYDISKNPKYTRLIEFMNSGFENHNSVNSNLDAGLNSFADD